jgi:hypothetical protein
VPYAPPATLNATAIVPRAPPVVILARMMLAGARVGVTVPAPVPRWVTAPTLPATDGLIGTARHAPATFTVSATCSASTPPPNVAAAVVGSPNEYIVLGVPLAQIPRCSTAFAMLAGTWPRLPSRTLKRMGCIGVAPYR